MAVIGTVCALCALPVQHDHYVPESTWIYRGSSPREELTSIFTPEHAWLEDAVGLRRAGSGPARLRGRVEDGRLTDRDSGHRGSVVDSDEYEPFHEACWRAMGAPEAWTDAVVGAGIHQNAILEAYCGQLFELPQLVADGKGWMLVDPHGASPEAARSRARVEDLLAAARRAVPLGTRVAASVEGMLRSGRGWTTAVSFDEDDRRTGLVRYRKVPWPFTPTGDLCFDLSAYPTLVCFIEEYDADDVGAPRAECLDRLERFERRLKEAVEEGEVAVLVATSFRRGQAEYYVYARDEAATMARIDALPERVAPERGEYDNAADPEWRIFFEDVDPRRRR
ncbi:MAG: DUF695 domain-containing protein [Labilithrix sp.]|nr:DUF695 domain-containing protein [Labilithrix sp.]MCW5832305.1 DUF695 domain-containing protein [Labilithrix sp.]